MSNMAVGGELAALFARRMEGDVPVSQVVLPSPLVAVPKSELAAVLDRRAKGGRLSAPSAAAPQAAKNAVPGLFPKSANYSPNSSSKLLQPGADARTPISTPSRTALAAASPASTAQQSVPMSPVEEPVRIASIVENEEVKAIFDERNLEVGIPTPAFLLNVRANLKKPGSAPIAKSPVPTSLKCPGSKSVERSISVKNDNNDVNNTTGKTCNSEPSIISDNNSGACISNISAPADEKTASPAVVAATGDAEKNSKDRSKSEVSQLALNARRRRMVAARSTGASVSSSVSDLKVLTIDDSNCDVSETASNSPRTTSAIVRRGKLLAKVRASHITHSAGQHKNTTKLQPMSLSSASDVFKTQIHSPKSEEFEVLFANHDFGDTDDINPQTLVPMDESPIIKHRRPKLMINVADGSNSTVGSGTESTVTNNALTRSSSSNNLASEVNKINVTPEKLTMKIHNASTPKTRGSFRREIYYSSSKSSPKKHLPSMQEQQQTETEGYIVEPPQLSLTPHNFAQAYPFRQSPSQLSLMSGITTPSCFPQDLNAQSGGTTLVHLQQPMLIGGPIPESYSSSSSALDAENNVAGDIVGGTLAEVSAFSSGVEAENRRLREELGKCTQRLDEKDAIISQLMKRIGDLELMSYSAARGVALAYQSNTTLSQSPCEAQHFSSGQLSLAHQLSAPANTITSRLARSTSSLETESACLSTHQTPVVSNLQEQSHQHMIQKQRSNIIKSSPSNTHTSSTASVTTTGSVRSKNSRRSRSSHRRSQSTTSDERKFVC